MNVFESSAAELDKLHERVHELARRRSESPEVKAAWREAAQTFHANYDRLAFPGGLAREFERLRNGDTEAIELAIRYLEANPWYFRSGYHKAEILKFLKRYPLTQEQCARLRQVILDRVRGKPTREMRAYARIAPRVTNDQFEAEILAIKEKSNRYSARSAGWVLENLNRTGSNWPEPPDLHQSPPCVPLKTVIRAFTSRNQGFRPWTPSRLFGSLPCEECVYTKSARVRPNFRDSSQKLRASCNHRNEHATNDQDN